MNRNQFKSAVDKFLVNYVGKLPRNLSILIQEHELYLKIQLRYMIRRTGHQLMISQVQLCDPGKAVHT